MDAWKFSEWLQLGERLGVPVFVLLVLLFSGGFVFWRVARFLAPIVKEGANAHVTLVNTLNESEKTRSGNERRQTELMEVIAKSQQEIAHNQERLAISQQKISDDQVRILNGLLDDRIGAA